MLALLAPMGVAQMSAHQRLPIILCELTSREYLVQPDGPPDFDSTSPKVLRLGLTLPESWTGPPAC